MYLFVNIVMVCFASSRSQRAVSEEHLKFTCYSNLIFLQYKTQKTDFLKQAKRMTRRLKCDHRSLMRVTLELIEKSNVEVCAANFYTINKSFILTFLGMCFTYAIILLQNQ